jgi:hypothetical protein
MWDTLDHPLTAVEGRTVMPIRERIEDQTVGGMRFENPAMSCSSTSIPTTPTDLVVAKIVK